MSVTILRGFGAVVAGLFVSIVLMVLVEVGSNVVHPFPPGVDPHDIEACRAHVANYPTWVLALVVPLWGFMVFAGNWVATRLGANRHPAHGIIVGTALLAAVVFNMAMLPYPKWFWLNVVTFPLCCAAGVLAASKRNQSVGVQTTGMREH